MKLYLIQRSGGGETFLKVGVTRKNDANERHFHGVTKVIDADLPLLDKVTRLLDKGQVYIEEGPYPTVRRITELDFEEDGQALFLEQSVIERFSKHRYTPRHAMSGASECYHYSPEVEESIRAYVQGEHLKMNTFPYGVYYSMASLEIRETDLIKRHLAIVAAMDKKKKRP